jgi:hypothetical protein
MTTCRSAVNAQVAFKRITTARIVDADTLYTREVHRVLKEVGVE